MHVGLIPPAICNPDAESYIYGLSLRSDRPHYGTPVVFSGRTLDKTSCWKLSRVNPACLLKMLWGSGWHFVLMVVLDQRSESSKSHQGRPLGTRSVHSKWNPNLLASWGGTSKKKILIICDRKTFRQRSRRARRCAQEMSELVHSQQPQTH